MRLFFLAFILIFLSGCQQSASSNRDLSDCDKNASLKYPLKTGQTEIFAFEDISTSPSTFYYDDGFDKVGYTREFSRLPDQTVYNKNYNLYWQDNEAVREHNVTAAQNYCTNLTLGGYTDWRLPNIYELLTLLDLGSTSTLVESSFDNMPNGFYYSSNEVVDSNKTYVVGFEQNDFNITKIDRIYDANKTNADYGTLVGVIQEPKYTSQGALLYISEANVYYDQIQNILTTITIYKRFDVNGILTTVDGPFTVQETPLHPPTIKPIKDSYIKCVRGQQVSGFQFTRDAQNGVVLDNKTHLMWQDNEDVVNKRFQWGGAEKYCSGLSLAGYDDWRVPTISELSSIVDLNNSNSTYAVSNTFLYKSANKFHSSSNLCHGVYCKQKNLQLNTCGYLDDLVTENIEIDSNPYDNNMTEPYFKVRCVRCGGYE